MIAMCAYCTEENKKLKYLKTCIESLLKTVDLGKHRLIIINQNSTAETKKYLQGLDISKNNIQLIHLSKNIGTSDGINMALKQRISGEVCVKSDEDLAWETEGWLDELTETIENNPEIGILGLKRGDVWQRPDHENPTYRTKMEGNLEICDDIFGTCTAYNPLLLDKVGYLRQPSLYSFDDVILSVRSIAAGFKNAFLPHIKITNLDEGGTPYTEWKKREANTYLQEVHIMCNLIIQGKLSYYYDGE